MATNAATGEFEVSPAPASAAACGALSCCEDHDLLLVKSQVTGSQRVLCPDHAGQYISTEVNKDAATA